MAALALTSERPSSAVSAVRATVAVRSSASLGSATERCVGKTSRRYAGYFCSIALVPSLSFASCCATSLALTEKSGFSAAKGSLREPLPATYPAGACVRPPVYSGMLPSALPDFAAPTAVNDAPNFFASSAVSLALAPYESSATIAAADEIILFMVVSNRSFLKGGLGGEHDALAVLEQRQKAVAGRHGLSVVEGVAVEPDVLDVEAQPGADVRAEAQGVGPAARIAAERDRRVPPEVERAVQRHEEIDAVEDLVPGRREARADAGAVLGGAAVVLVLGEAGGAELRAAAADAGAHSEEHVLVLAHRHEAAVRALDVPAGDGPERRGGEGPECVRDQVQGVAARLVGVADPLRQAVREEQRRGRGRRRCS